MTKLSIFTVLLILLLIFQSDCRLLDSDNIYEGKMGVKEKMKKRTDEKAGAFYRRKELLWIHSPNKHCYVGPC
ncbi:hypothetical protein SUGI_0411920 [Cryptomeria japonica]|nr:hypothetical protein SUGI_0411920 [Cryptomeria japonica]